MILHFHKIEGEKVYYSVEDTKNRPIEISLIDTNSNTIIFKVKKESLMDNCIYWIAVPVSCVGNLGKVILEAVNIEEHLGHSGVVKLEIDFGNIVEPVVINNSIFKSSFDDRSNFYTFKEIFYDKIYHDEVVKVEENDIVVDIGANIGFFTVYANQFNPKKIICLEPDIRSYLTLLEHTKKFDNVDCYNLAISDEIGIVSFCYSDIISAGSHLKKFRDLISGEINLETNVLAIDLEKLFDLFNLTHIDFLKIDCEGGEKDVFKTIKNSTLKKIKKISLEFHSLEIKNQITEKLIENGFEIVKEFFLHSSNTIGAIFALNKTII